MKLNVDAKLVSLSGEVHQTVKGQDLTLGIACLEALLAPYPNDQDSGPQKAHRYELAKRLYEAKSELDLSVEDVELIKAFVGKAYGPTIVGPVYKLLEGV